MSTLTKIELVQINSKLAAENEALRARLQQLSNDMQIITGKTTKLASAARPDVAQRHEAMQAARRLAMASGKMIKV